MKRHHPFLVSLWIETMKRCRWITLPSLHSTSAAAFTLATALIALLPPASAAAQGADANATPQTSPSASPGNWRQFPVKAERGTLRIMVTPEVLLNGKADRLSPGARIRNIHNGVTTPMSLGDDVYVVNYLRNAQGEIHDVWLLTPDEAKAKLPSMTARAQRRDEAKDDGKTPFNDLPKWNPASPR